MQASGGSSLHLKMDIQSELVFIDAVVTKIKQELHEINGIVQDNGSLDTSLEHTIESLVSLAREAGVVLKEPTTNSQEENRLTNALNRITTGYITEKLKALSHE